MSRQDIRKLLGGYATGTLTPEEQQALFEAALQDQALFDELAREQSLHDLLRDPAARGELLAALDDRPHRWYVRWWRPAALAGAMAAVAVLAVVMVQQKPQPVKPVTFAEVKPPAVMKSEAVPQEAPAPLAAPSPQVRRKFDRNSVAQAPPPAQSKPAAAPELPEAPAVTAASKPPLASSFLDTAPSGPRGGAVGGIVGGVIGGVPPGAYSNPIRAFAPSPPQTAGRANSPRQSMMVRAAAEAVPAPAVTVQLKPWTLLRKQPAGDFTEVDPADLKKGDTLKLRFQSNESGYLKIRAKTEDGSERQVASVYVLQHTAYTSDPLQPTDQELMVSFEPAAADARSIVPVRAKAAPPRAPLSFTIPLKYN